MKKKLNKTVKYAIALYVALLGVALVVIFALFVFDRKDEKRKEDDITLTASGDLEISLDRENWDKKQVPKASYSCPIITSDGVNFNYSDSFGTEDDADEMKGSFNINSRDDRGEFYVDMVLHFRASGNSTVYLQSTSFVKGVDMTTNGDDGKTVPNGAVAGALRVAFYEIPADKAADTSYQPTENDLRFIWIPNERYEIASDAEGKLSFKNNGTGETSYGYLDPTSNEIKAWNAADYALGKVAVGNVGLATGSSTANGTEYFMINNATPLLDFGGSAEPEEKTMLIRIWVEGTDREARSRLESDMVRYKFNFISIDKQAPSEADVAALKGITYDGERLSYAAQGYDFSKNHILYSYDGITWVPYSPTNHPGFDNLYIKENGDQVLFVKLEETADTKPSEYHEVVIVPASSDSGA